MSVPSLIAGYPGNIDSGGSGEGGFWAVDGNEARKVRLLEVLSNVARSPLRLARSTKSTGSPMTGPGRGTETKI